MTSIGPGLTVSYTEFSPGELSQMTGFSQDLQRVWRKRGQLAGSSGKTARFNVLKVAELFVRHELSLWGISPKDSIVVGSEAAPNVLYFALLNGDGACQVTGTLSQAEKFIAEFAGGDEIAREMSGCTDNSRFIWSPQRNDFRMAADMGPLLAQEIHTSILVLDLGAMGTTLANRATRPLFSVHGPTLASERTVRKLTNAQ
ncbi:hypothetical protein LZ518_05450 [Sphingomonas sp. RB56-2]|uniref:Uncharacterized protein n=1 Tax=Sphingomonas brevis TaxID=2908206 RepID=A0ABT0S831_9SPHN|nr:hypothetical protein [Sphingomonas brevis]MCL6740576.1 hypothetical protein [Sphingomonas brevis]